MRMGVKGLGGRGLTISCFGIQIDRVPIDFDAENLPGHSDALCEVLGEGVWFQPATGRGFGEEIAVQDGSTPFRHVSG